MGKRIICAPWRKKLGSRSRRQRKPVVSCKLAAIEAQAATRTGCTWKQQFQSKSNAALLNTTERQSQFGTSQDANSGLSRLRRNREAKTEIAEKGIQLAKEQLRTSQIKL